MRKVVTVVLALEVVLLASVYLYFCHRVGAFGFPLDDSWIHAHFARNIAEGRGFVYNPGQNASSTAMLYSLILAGMYAITKAPILNAIALGLALHYAAAILVCMIGRRLSLSPLLAAASAVIFAAIPRLIWGALSGMEVSLYVFLVCLGIYWHISCDWRDGFRSYLSTLVFGLAALARPECAVFVVCSFADRMVSYLRFGRHKVSLLRVVKTALIHLAVFCAVIAPVMLYNLSSYGKPLPAAFYAKTWRISNGEGTDGMLSVAVDRAAACIRQTASAIWRDNSVLCILLIPGVIHCVRGSRKQDSLGGLLLPISLLLVPLATAYAAPTGRLAQLTTQHGRYSAYLCPLLVLIAVLGLAHIRDLLNAGRSPWVGRAFAGGVLAAAGLLLVISNWTCAQRYGLEVQNTNEMQVAFGKWAATLPDDTVIAANDVGAIAYFSRRRIVDTVGVVNPEVVSYLTKYSDRNTGLLEYLEARRPDYVIIFPRWYKSIARRHDILTRVKTIRLKTNLISGDAEMVAYRTKWN